MNSALPRTLPVLILCLIAQMLHAQTQSATVEVSERPLPDIPTLMHEVEQHQRAGEAIQKNYLYHETATQRENNGKTETREYDVFWLNSVQVRKMTRKDGRDLTADEQKKENDRIDKEVEKAKDRKSKAEAKGKETDSRGHEEITVSRFLLLGSFTNPRRVQLDGRDTIVIDYIGDPKAQTRNRAEDVIRNLAGTLWVDEQDRSITRIQGHFVNNFKVGGGLVMNIKKDTSFSMQQKKINSEVWLPEQIDGQGGARVMLFVNLNGSIHVTDSDYRKFKATSTILPGVTTVSDTTPDTPGSPSPETTSPNPQ